MTTDDLWLRDQQEAAQARELLLKDAADTVATLARRFEENGYTEEHAAWLAVNLYKVMTGG